MRKTIILLAACIATLLLGYTGYRGYKVWKQSHWLTMAKNFAAKADSRNELLSLQQVLRLNPRSLEACRMMAALADAMHSPTALVWRQRTLDLNPQSLVDRLALAQTAISFSAFAVASNALAGVSAHDQNTAMYHNVMGVLATGTGRNAEALKQFSESVRLDPANPVLQMNLAVLKLHDSNQLDMAEARINLQRLSQNPTNSVISTQAKRELTLDAVRQGDMKSALALSQKLTQSTNAAFADRLLRLEVLQRAQSPDFKSFLSTCQREAAGDPTRLSQMAVWLLRQTSTSQTLTWLKSLPVSVQTNQPAAMLVADCRVQLHDWRGLQADIQNQNWGDMDVIRHALMARSLRGQNLEGASAAEWGVAMQLTHDQKAGLIALFRLAAQWKWNDEAQQILWKLVNQYPEEQWAVAPLSQSFMAEGRTRSLLQLFSLLAKRSPDNVELKNNLVMVTMLLGSQDFNTSKMAQEVYDKDPTNPACISTYAFSLFLQKKPAEALKLMQKLTPKQLGDPSIAGYYGLILQANGHGEQAKPCLRLALKGTLLPEEKQLFEKALMN